jgi:23S rRNA pseudouridine955/2504/2580 synthase
LTVATDDAGMRLDRWITRHFQGLTHARLQKLLRTGQIRLDGKRAESSSRIQPGQLVRVPPQLVEGDCAEGQPNERSGLIHGAERLRDLVLFEDDDVVALNKPAGLAVQGGTGLKENLDDSLMAFSRDGKTRPKLVHRLDRDTSGVLLIARNDYAAAKLAAAFRGRDAQKIYWAVTVGVPKPLQGRIDASLIKRGEKMMMAEAGDDEAKKASTLYKVLESAAGKAALVALQPLTGRTHQLRVHMAVLGCPILGDRVYGGDKSPGLPLNELGKGLHLHARRLVLPHPRGGEIDVTAPLNVTMRRTFRWFGFEEDSGKEFDY